jgi:hypothetical protein
MSATHYCFYSTAKYTDDVSDGTLAFILRKTPAAVWAQHLRFDWLRSADSTI